MNDLKIAFFHSSLSNTHTQTLKHEYAQVEQRKDVWSYLNPSSETYVQRKLLFNNIY